MKQNENSKNWYAVYTRPRAEFKAAEQLKDSGIEFYMPVVTRVKKWSDRKKKVTEPVIRSYIFIFADEKERVKALENYSVVRCVFDAGKPAVIPEWQINNLKKMLEVSSDVIVKSGLVPGVKVRILNGPFAGVEGIYSGEDNEKTLAVTINLLNRSIIAQLPPNSELEIIRGK